MALKSKDLKALPKHLQAEAQRQLDEQNAQRAPGSGIPIPKPGRRHKYNVGPKELRRSDLWGCTVHSIAERLYGDRLYYMQQAGEIAELDRQIKVALHDPDDRDNVRSWAIDFVYQDGRLDCQVWDEFKGCATGPWLAYQRLWEKCGPGLLRVTSGRVRRGVLTVTYTREFWPAGKGGGE